MLRISKRRFPTSLALGLAATALIATACGDDDDDGSPGSGGSSAGAPAKGGGAGAGQGGKATGTGGSTAGNPGTGGAPEAGSPGLGGSGGAAGSGTAGEGGAVLGEGGSGGAAGGSVGVGGEGGNPTGELETYVASLSGAEETPPVNTSATGSATFTYDPADNELSWTLTQDVDEVTAAHIHLAPPGEDGPPIVTLPTAASASGTATLTEEQEEHLRLGHLYVNIHSPEATDGEIRGQILEPGSTLWIANLTGAQEVPPSGSTGTAVASLIVNAEHTSARYHLNSSVTPSAAHIHTAIAGVNGDVRHPLTLDGSTASGELAFTAEDFTALDRTQLYVNVHTTAFPNGELRGQLLRPGSWLFAANLTGAQEVPSVVTTGTGNASVALDFRSLNVRYAVTTSLTPTAAHIHDGIAGVSGPAILPFTTLGKQIFGTGTLPEGGSQKLSNGELYVNVHTTAQPDGEIRGQLLQPGERLYTARLTGAQEVPPVITTATGATQLILNAPGTSLKYNSVVTGLLDATGAHIHTGAVGVEGAVVHPLTLVGLNPRGVIAVTSADIPNLNNSLYYVNIHSTLNADGELRGQIVPR